MVLSDKREQTNEIQEDPNGREVKNHISLQIQTSQIGLLKEKRHNNGFLDILRFLPNRTNYMNFNPSPSAKFRRIVEERDTLSRSIRSTDHISPPHHHVPFTRDINFPAIWKLCKGWVRNPMNMALFVWIACVAISGALLFLVMTGMLNAVLPNKTQRDSWFEVNNQILNALFTLMCLYQHPKRFYHLVLLCRWRPEDVLKLRKVYCKNGAYKPNEWTHMMAVVLLLNLNCFAQYALCGLNLGYPRSKRPPIGVGLCVAVSIGAPAFASVYNILSPLGRDYEVETEEESQHRTTSGIDGRQRSLQKKYSFIARETPRTAESKPEWVGGLFDFWDDISVAYLSFFCSCCVFGWNMNRLGFGNMYVHIATFLLFCLAPFFIFNLAALNINNEAVRETLGISGILLCVFGLLYGGFWRIQMRKKFNLPQYTFCCRNPSVTDCFLWFCCCACSLAQEVRTADSYDVVEDKLCMKQARDDEVVGLPLSPLPREDGLTLLRSSPTSPYSGRSSPSLSKMGSPMTPSKYSGLPLVKEPSMEGRDETMQPPDISVARRD